MICLSLLVYSIYELKVLMSWNGATAIVAASADFLFPFSIYDYEVLRVATRHLPTLRCAVTQRFKFTVQLTPLPFPLLNPTLTSLHPLLFITLLINQLPLFRVHSIL